MISFKILKVEHFHAMVVLRKMLKMQQKHHQNQKEILQIQIKIYNYLRSSQNEINIYEFPEKNCMFFIFIFCDASTY